METDSCLVWLDESDGDVYEFRPLKTERDIAIEKGMEINRTLGIGATEQEMFGALYDAGLIK